MFNTDAAYESNEPDTSVRFNFNFQHVYLWDASLERASTSTPPLGNTCGLWCGRSGENQRRSMPRLFILDASV